MKKSENQEFSKMEIYLELMIKILQVKPHFIKTIPKDMAIKILLVIALDTKNNELLETLIINCCEQHGNEFLNEMQEVVDNPNKFLKDE